MLILTIIISAMLLFFMGWNYYLINRNRMSTWFRVLTRQQDKVNLYKELLDNTLEEVKELREENKSLKSERRRLKNRKRLTVSDS